MKFEVPEWSGGADMVGEVVVRGRVVGREGWWGGLGVRGRWVMSLVAVDGRGRVLRSGESMERVLWWVGGRAWWRLRLWPSIRYHMDMEAEL